LVIDAAGCHAEPEQLPLLDVVRRAVFNDRRLRLDYRPRPGRQPGARTVDPYGLLQAAGDRMISTGSVPAIRGAAGVLAGLGDQVTVIDPPELIDALLAVADEIRGAYPP
jgi:predicted DNA-binding transcriptional regulator YafY